MATPTNNPPAAPSGQLISLVDILRIIRKRWKSGFLAAALIAGPVVFLLLQQEETYTAQASVMIEMSPENIMDIGEADTRLNNVRLLNTVMATHIERIRTRTLAEEVAAAVPEALRRRLAEGYVGPLEERPAGAGPPDVAGLILKNSLEVERGEEEDSQVLLIRLTHADPEVAQVLANVYVEQYIKLKASLRSTTTTEAVRFLKDQVEAKRGELARMEDELQAYRREHNLVSVQQDQGIVVERLNRINGALTDANIRLLEVRGRANQIEAAGDDVDRLMQIPFLGEREETQAIYAQLNELRREREVLDETYLSRHPKVRQNEASMKAVSEALDRALEQTRRQVLSELEATRAEVASLEEKLAEAEGAVLDGERALVEYQRMSREVEKQREIFDTLATRYNQALVAQEMNLNIVTVLDRARLPRSPNSASLIQVLAVGVFLGGVFFAGVPLALELMDDRLTSFADVERFTEKPLLGDLAWIRRKSFPKLAQGVAGADPDVAETFRAVFSNIRMRSDLSSRGLSFVVTSSLPGEGKSMVASNLAAAIASHDYGVLLVDCDLRRSMQHEAWGLDNEVGLCRWHAASEDDAPPEEPLEDPDLGITVVGENLFLLRSGGSGEHPTELFGDRKMEGLFAALKERFDVLVFDTPPVGLFPDATLVADFADHCVFVARQFKVKRNKLRYSVGQMERTAAPVMGVVFNGIRSAAAALGYGASEAGHYGHGYEKDRSKYADYYRRKG